MVTGPSASPENGFKLPDGKTGSGICLGPTIDMQQLRELFGNVIRAAKILGIDEDLQQELAEKRPRLAPNQIALDGVLQEWLKPYEEREPTHRHCSPLYGHYPYYEITADGTPKMAEAARKLLERRGTGQSIGWSNAWRVNLWARMGDEEKSWEFVNRMVTDNCFDNMLSLFRPLENGNGKKLFQIEANFGLTSGIVEMLMQSQPDSGAIDAKPIIRILPALPKAWLTGKVTGLVARGGVEVDIEWKDGELIDCELRSDHDTALLKVSYDGTTVGMSLKAGKPTKVFASKDADKVL
jgi:alpha-L-fucosidase 2